MSESLETLKKQYEQDCLNFERPGELWLYRRRNAWMTSPSGITWQPDCEYRRKDAHELLSNQHYGEYRVSLNKGIDTEVIGYFEYHDIAEEYIRQMLLKEPDNSYVIHKEMWVPV